MNMDVVAVGTFYWIQALIFGFLTIYMVKRGYI